MEFSEMFYMFVITSSVAFVLKLASMAYKSKCKQVECCCITVKRDTVTEEKEMEFITQHRMRTRDSLDDSNKLSI